MLNALKGISLTTASPLTNISKEYAKAIPYLTISEAVELKGKLELVSKERNEKIGELERDNINLRRELDGTKEQLKILTEMLSKKQT